MKIKHRKPEIYERCKQVFGIDWEKGIIITYGDTVYCKYPITKDLEAHEATHVEQQKNMGVETWWDRYLIDKDFRLEQEVEAYKNQVKYMKENYSRAERRMIERHIYKSMASIYGDMCTEEQARELIQ